MPHLPSELRQALTERIEALVPSSAYRQQSYDAWREAESPIVPELQPAPAAHLAFFVDDRNLDDTGRERASVDDGLLAEAPIDVRFWYRVRPVIELAKSDWDGAATAAVHLLRHLLAEGWQDIAVIRPDPSVIRRLPVGTAEGSDPFLLVTVRVRALYELTLAEL